jgi:hypothetical protein
VSERLKTKSLVSLEYLLSKEELPQQWKKSIIPPFYKEGDETECNCYRGISLLPAANKILSSILISRLTPYTDKVNWDHQYGFQCNISTFFFKGTYSPSWTFGLP